MFQEVSASTLKQGRISYLFFLYFLPSLLGMLALSTYTTVDGIFVGKKLGESGLAAIGIAWPIFPAFIAFELLFSVGAAALSSYYLGKNKPKRAREVFSAVFYFTLVGSLCIGLGLFISKEEIALLLGSSATLAPLVVEYTQIIYLGIFAVVLHPLLDIFAIHDKQPALAMVAMVVGSVMNIVLNYLFLFVWELGMSGAALSTVLGHGIGMSILLGHFLKKKGNLYFVKSFRIPLLWHATKNGIPQASSELSMSCMMLLCNHTISLTSGDRGLAIYSLLMYVGIIPFTILLSMAQSVQAIASFNYGARLMERVRGIFVFGVGCAFVGGVLLYFLFYALAPLIIPLFIQDDIKQQDATFMQDSQTAMGIHFLGFILLGPMMVSAIFLQAIQQTLSSLVITLSYTLLFAIPFVLVLPKFFGFFGIVAAYPLGLLCAGVVACLIVHYQFKWGILKNHLS